MSSTVRLGSRRRGKAVTIAQSISIALSSSARTVVQGSTTTLTVTLTRVGGYTGDVTPSVTGLPSGVTGSWSDSSLTGADATTVLTLTADIAAGLVTADAFTVTCSGSGVTDATAAATVTVEAAGSATPFFEENFTGGVLNPYGDFTWNDSASYTNGASVLRRSLSTDYAYSGTHSLKFSYGPEAQGVNGEQGSAMEFGFNRDLSEVWVECYLRIPSNFVQRNNTPATSNNKLFLLRKDYSGTSVFRYVTEFQYNTVNNQPDGSVIRSAARLTTTSVEDCDGIVRSPLFGGPDGPAAVGEWSRIRWHLAMSDPYDASNGILKIWVNDTVVTDVSNRLFNDLTTSTRATFDQGYFMGASNSGYVEETIFYLDAIKFYDTDPGW